MKYTEAQIITIAENVMQQIDFGYNTKVPRNAWHTSKEDYYERWKDLKGFDQIKDRIKADWTVSFKFEEEMEMRRDSIFLDIDDESGEPIELSHAQATFIISKDENGKYIKTLKPRR